MKKINKRITMVIGIIFLFLILLSNKQYAKITYNGDGTALSDTLGQKEFDGDKMNYVPAKETKKNNDVLVSNEDKEGLNQRMKEKGYDFVKKVDNLKYKKEGNLYKIENSSILPLLTIPTQTQYISSEIVDFNENPILYGKAGLLYEYQGKIIITDTNMYAIIYENVHEVVFGVPVYANVYIYKRNLNLFANTLLDKGEHVIGIPKFYEDSKIETRLSEKLQREDFYIVNKVEEVVPDASNTELINLKNKGIKTYQVIHGLKSSKEKWSVFYNCYFDETYGIWACQKDKETKIVDGEGKPQGGTNEEDAGNKSYNDYAKNGGAGVGTTFKELTFTSSDQGTDREVVTYVDPLDADGKDFYNFVTPSEKNTFLKNTVSKVVGIIQAVGSVISVIILAVLGIKYMFGSVEEKADYKKELPVYVLGAVILFAITNLLGVVYKIMMNFNFS